MPHNSKLPTGKVPSEILQKTVFNYLGVPDKRIISGPNVGEDAAIIDMGEKVIVIATDPITGAEEKIGWLSVHINANDVASCGAKPRWFLTTLLLPEDNGEEILRTIMSEMHSALVELDISLIGGHTETTPGLDRPIIVGFMMGETSKHKYVKTGGARVGDKIILTKGAGIEGTSIIASEFKELLFGRIEEHIIQSCEAMIDQISIVPEALEAIESGEVHSLHDPTEGGVLNGLWEMAEASKVGLEIIEDNIPVYKETLELCEKLEIDPLKLLGSGALLIVTLPEDSEKILEKLHTMGIQAGIIGEITEHEKGRWLVKRDGSKNLIEAVKQDELYRLIDMHKSFLED